ncbi:MAG TPA: carbohydrate kinase family protein [Candidatus Deferrimicrobium sp.]|nr:carbohydrate kinase family protein [Candidatus Deferrimicrobium sp.]
MVIYVIGHLAIDEVIINGKNLPISLGGTAAFSSLVCSRFVDAKNVSVISKVGPDFPLEFLDYLTRSGINTQFVDKVKRHSTRYRLEYIDDERELTLKSVCAPITIEDFPEELFNAQLIYFGPIANEIPIETIIATKERSNSIVALDIQGLIRHRTSKGELYFKSGPKIDELLEYIDIIKLDLKESQIVSGASKFRQIVSYLSSLGVKMFIITKSRRGSELYYMGKLIKIPSIILRQIYNTTGAGDCFFSSFLMEYLKNKDPLQAVQFATKAVSYLIGSETGIQSFFENGDIYTLIEKFIQENRVK